MISYRKWSCRQMVCITYVSEGEDSVSNCTSALNVSSCIWLFQKEKQIVQYSWVKLLMGTVFDFFYLNYMPRKVKEGRKHYVTLLGCLVSSFRDNSEFPNISFLKCSPHKVVTINQYVVQFTLVWFICLNICVHIHV